jgi:hypothetical protein
MKEGAIRRLLITCDELYAWLYSICGLDSMCELVFYLWFGLCVNLYDLIMDICTLFVALVLVCTYYGHMLWCLILYVIYLWQ